jgi:hypothetical protein
MSMILNAQSLGRSIAFLQYQDRSEDLVNVIRNEGT